MLFSNSQGLSSKSYYNKVIGENDGGIYLLRFKNSNLDKHVSIERYTHALGYLGNEVYYLQKNERLLKCFTVQGGLNLISLQKKRRSQYLLFAQLGMDMNTEKSRTEFFSSDHIENNDEALTIDYSPDRGRTGIWVAEHGNNDKQRFSYLMLNAEGQAEYTVSREFPFSTRNAEIVESSCSPSGKSVAILHVENTEESERSPAGNTYYLISADASGISEAQQLNTNFFITDISLVYNEEKHKFDIAAFYDFKSGKSNQGLFHCSMRDGTDTVSEPVFSKFNDELIGKVIGAKALEKGEEMENFKFRRLVPRSDGGLLMISEKFFISQQFETFYFNGIPQTSSKNIYNYDDLLILSMDSSGQLEWGHAEYKKQNAFSQGAYYLSVGVYAFEDHVYLIYNDNLSQNNRVLMLTLSRDGVLKQNIILKSEEEPTFVVPFEGRQVGYNAFVLPVLHDNELSLMKITE